MWGSNLSAQSPPPITVFPSPAASPAVYQDQQSEAAQAPAPKPPDSAKPVPPAPAPPASSAAAQSAEDSQQGQQTKRILGIVPNFLAVSANAHLPPLSPKQKFWLATQGTFDYSSFISVGIQAGVEQATNTYPEFHQGAAGYGRYYWHTFADAAVQNYLAGAIFPSLTHEDPRYYTLYRGGFFHRTGYAVSRLWITKNDAGARRFNFSEIFGSGVATQVSALYYAREERGGAADTIERWASSLLNDAVGNIFQEFWPDIHQKFFRRHAAPSESQPAQSVSP